MTYAVKKCVFQYHEYDRRPGKSIGVLGCNAPPPKKNQKTKDLIFFNVIASLATRILWTYAVK